MKEKMEQLKRTNPFIKFNEQGEFFDFLDELKKTDIWKPLNLREVKLSEALNVEGPCCDYEMFLGDETVNVNNCAHYTLKRRAKNNSDILHDMPVAVSAECLNMSWPWVPNPDAIALIRGDQIIAVHSDTYAIITQEQVFKMFDSYLLEAYDERTFTGATYTHELSKASYVIEDSQFEDNLVSALEECGYSIEPGTAEVSVVLSTSDTGNSCVTVVPYLKFGDQPRFPFAKPLKVMHKGDEEKRMEMIEKNFKKLLSLLVDGVENLKRLYNINIEHPYECAENLCRKVAIPVGMVSALEGRLDGFGSMTAGDIYVILCEIVYTSEFEERSVRNKLQIQDGLSKILFMSDRDWKRNDR